MLISYRWLGRHVDLAGITPEDVAGDLTLHTAEVEGVHPFLPVLEDVVVGHVVERVQHEGADKLSVCTVDVGAPERLRIVCGAPNVARGQKVAVAREGTTLPGDLRIKRSKIRGVESFGMICSERELGLGEEHSGIWVLPEDSAVGQPVAAAVGARDALIEIDNKSLTHRPDLWGHRGIAGEIAAIRGLALVPLSLSLPEPNPGGAPFPVRIEHPHCSRYIAVPIDGVRSGRSPDWLRHLLLAVGQRPIGLLVDVSNFVMLDIGQPNHLFDRRKLAEGIVVRKARPGERMATLDGVERTLVEDDLLICSGETPVALAGVMGGAGSEVAEDTDELLLEVATFDPTCVRRSSARLGLRTDASARFEKHLDPTLPGIAAAHLVNLLRELRPGLSLPARRTDAGEWRDPARTVTLRPGRARAVLGTRTSDLDMARMLGALGFRVEERDGALEVAVPSARATVDVRIEEDLIEEVGRLLRYDRIEERSLEGPLIPAPRDERRELVRRLQDALARDARFHEAQTYSFLSDELLEQVREAGAPHLALLNPVAEGVGRIRRGIVPSLLALLPANLRQREEVRLFEVGKGYLPEHRGERVQPREVHEVGVVLAAPPPGPGARFDAGALPRLRGVVEDLIRAAGRPLAQVLRPEPHALPGWAHPGASAVLLAAGDAAPELALVAALEPGVARALGIGADVACARISIDGLLRAAERPLAYRPIPRVPGVKLDVALAGPAALPAAELVCAIERAGKGLVSELELFDVYAGGSVGDGRRSLAWHLVLQDAEATLGEKDVQKFLVRLEREAGALGAELRRE